MLGGRGAEPDQHPQTPNFNFQIPDPTILNPNPPQKTYKPTLNPNSSHSETRKQVLCAVGGVQSHPPPRKNIQPESLTKHEHLGQVLCAVGGVQSQTNTVDLNPCPPPIRSTT